MRRGIWLLVVGSLILLLISALSAVAARLVLRSLILKQTDTMADPNGIAYHVAMQDLEGRLVLGDLETGDTTTIDRKPVSLAWSPNGDFLALSSTDPSGSWIVDLPRSSLWQIAPERNLRFSWAQWSPSSTQLAFWADSEEGTLSSALYVYRISSRSYQRIPGTEYNCNFSVPAWSFDEQWIIFGAGRCESDAEGYSLSVENEVVSFKLDGSGRSTIAANMSGEIYPSPVDDKVLFGVYDQDARESRLCLARFSALEQSLVEIRDRIGARHSSLHWFPDGSSFYAGRYDSSAWEIRIVNGTTGELEAIWPDLSVGGEPHWSPRSKSAAFLGQGVYRLDLQTRTLNAWRRNLKNVCGMHWGLDDRISSVLVCESYGNVPACEFTVVRANGSMTRLGDGLYRVLAVSPADAASQWVAPCGGN